MKRSIYFYFSVSHVQRGFERIQDTHIHTHTVKKRGDNWKPFKGRRKINGPGICLE